MTTRRSRRQRATEHEVTRARVLAPRGSDGARMRVTFQWRPGPRQRYIGLAGGLLLEIAPDQEAAEATRLLLVRAMEEAIGKLEEEAKKP
jgi:hypothetical protein